MKIAMIGMGAYGIALAKVFYENGNEVSMWSKFKDEVAIVSLKRENINMLPGVKIPQEIDITEDIGKCLANANIVILAVPMAAVRDTAKEILPFIKKEQVIGIVSKGIEQQTNLLMSQVIQEVMGEQPICMISGPSFATDLIAQNEIGLVVASVSDEAKLVVKLCLENERIAVTTTNDMVGTEVASAAKNVFAILMGILEGMQVSDSTRASILAVVCDDLRIVIEMLGGRERTVFTYAGLGDLLLTCMSNKSRNYRFGKYIGEGFHIEEALEKLQTKTVEGLYTLSSLSEILTSKEIQIKSIELIYAMVYHGATEKNILRYIKK